MIERNAARAVKPTMRNNRFTKSQAVSFIKRAMAAGCSRSVHVTWDQGQSKCLQVALTFRRDYLYEGKPCDSLCMGGHFILMLQRRASRSKRGTGRWSASVTSAHGSFCSAHNWLYRVGAWDACYALGQCKLFNAAEDKKAAFPASVDKATELAVEMEA